MHQIAILPVVRVAFFRTWEYVILTLLHTTRRWTICFYRVEEALRKVEAQSFVLQQFAVSEFVWQEYKNLMQLSNGDDANTTTRIIISSQLMYLVCAVSKWGLLNTLDVDRRAFFLTRLGFVCLHD